ncbi:hypothetical protein [Rhizobium sp. GCM10022189]|uniref:hypothetical protein n=1 Tax=Rhizobium sp. GCM10022189 TaxID=3252654 RepID=UPI00361A519F
MTPDDEDNDDDPQSVGRRLTFGSLLDDLGDKTVGRRIVIKPGRNGKALKIRRYRIPEDPADES